MANRNEIVEYTNGLLGLHDYPDYGPMGLQFTGKSEVKMIATAVSVSYSIIEQAADWGADMLFTHHGLWWNNESRILDQRTAGRIAAARDAEMSILGYHLCLDAHPTIGNNALLADRLRLGNQVPFGEIGWGGTVNPHQSKDSHVWANGLFSDQDTFYLYGNEVIERVAVIAGGAPQYLTQAWKEGYDTFVTGEAAEYTMYQAQELNMNFIAAGHHRTEIAGIRMLGLNLSNQFDVEAKFFNAANKV